MFASADPPPRVSPSSGLVREVAPILLRLGAIANKVGGGGIGGVDDFEDGITEVDSDDDFREDGPTHEIDPTIIPFPSSASLLLSS